ncbi:aromatic ring-hydroxylating oxygenase subunit alpha [Salinithrix halophila]|uniref:Aromatic ring-hydroxylating dioxygenase subunit alpha n=1 Tax=Salinithrix halophila TaxID=1485204 RepID=A0ABV8JDK8_9BACL
MAVQTTQQGAKNIFSSELYQSVRLPCTQAETLPAWCYTSREWYQRELERIFLPAWHFLGRSEQIPTPGDYLTESFFGKSIILIRGKDHQIRAFYNSCRHRGSKLLTDKGNCKFIQCQYHNWTYQLDGSLCGTPYMEKVENFDKCDYGLDSVRCETMEGLIFITFNSFAPSLDDYLGDYRELVAQPYQLKDMVCVREFEYKLKSNWKFYVEVDMETIHTPNIHKSSIGVQEVERPLTWISVYHESEETVALHPGKRHLGFPHMEGLTGKAAKGTYFSILYPGFFIVTTKDAMWWIHKIPEGPEETRVKVGFCFPLKTVERQDFKEVAQRYYARWGQVIEEDNWITEFQHEVIHSSRPGRYSHKEFVVHELDNWILDKVLD